MIKNIIKRVIIGVLIALILGFINSCEVKALEYAEPYRFADQTRTNISSFYGVNHTVLFQYHWYYSNTNMTGPKYAAVFDTSDTDKFKRDHLYTVSIMLYYDTQSIDDFEPIVDFNASNCTVVTNQLMDVMGNDWEQFPGHFHSIICDNFRFTDDITYLNVWVENYNDNVNRPYFGRLYFTDSSLEGIVESLNQQTQTLNNINSNIQSQTNQQHQDSQQVQQSINDLNNTMKDDNTSDVDTTAINGASNSVATNNVISDLILLPVNLFTKILNSIDAGCFQYDLGVLFGTHLILPCINLSNILGNTLYTTIDLLISGLFVFYISRKMIKIFNEFSMLEKGRGIE